MSQAETARVVNPFSDGVAFIDGEFVPISEARIPIIDWGFLRSMTDLRLLFQ